MTSDGLRVVDAVAERLGGEAAEDDRMRRPDPGAGEHRDRQLRDHRHVDRDAVARRDPEFEQGVGRPAHLALEVGEGDGARVAGFTDPVIGDLVAEAALDVAIHAVVGDVELAANEPLGEGQVPFEGRMEVLDPIDPLARQRGPEPFVVRLGASVEVGGRVGLGDERRVGREGPVLGEQILDLGRRRRGRVETHVGTLSESEWLAVAGAGSSYRGRPRDAVPAGHARRGTGAANHPNG